jgi:hypothetical protein
LPRSRVAIFQSEQEVLRTPAFDVGPFLRGDGDRWHVSSFDERTLGAALDEERQFDALVVAFNALHQSGSAARDAFDGRMPDNLLLLHQLDPACFRFLTGDLALTVEEQPGGDLHPVRPPAERDAADEPLLNWPRAVPQPDDRTVLHGRAFRSFVPAEDSKWRIVLALERDGERFPVVMRTARVVRERVVVCSLLLEWRDPLHARLLDNMLSYCALGSPDVAVVAPPASVAPGYDADLLAARLRLRQARAFVVPLESGAAIPIGSWPCKTVRHIVVPGSIDIASALGDSAARAWQEAGGTLTTVGPHGELTLHNRATDARWVAERWATWYSGVDAAAWQNGLDDTRAVLRMLAAVHDMAPTGFLGLETPDGYPDEPLVALLRRRVRNGNCEQTISATAAAWDIDHVCGRRGLTTRTRRSVERWLRQAFNQAPGARDRDDPAPPLEDQFDIARALRDRRLLDAAFERASGQPVTALSLTRMREALVACAAWDGAEKLPQELEAGLDADTVVAELDGHPVVSAEFLSAVVELHRHAPSHPAARLDGAAVRAAIATVYASSALVRSGTAGQPTVRPVAITTEARALLGHMTVAPTTTWQLHPKSEGLPIQAVQEVLHESRQSRELVYAEGLAREAFGRATWVLGAAAVAFLAVAISWAFAWDDPSSPEWIVLAGALVVALGAIKVLSIVRARRGDPGPALAADVLGLIGIAAAFGLSYLALQAKPVDADVVNATVAGLVLAALCLAVLWYLPRAGLDPVWASWLRKQLREYNVPFFRGEEPAAKA